jgi:hypothetical protein
VIVEGVKTTITFDGSSVTIRRRFPDPFIARGERQIPLKEIRSVQIGGLDDNLGGMLHRAFVNPYIRFVLVTASHNDGPLPKRIWERRFDANTVFFRGRDSEAFLQFRDVLNRAISSR